MAKIELYNGDCLELMDKLIEDGVKVDMILTDHPYGTTKCKWDNIILFQDMWDRINKITKENAAIVLFGNEPFSSNLRVSNIKNYRYDWIWHKSSCSNFLNANKQPFFKAENISVFYKKQPTYNPQKSKWKPYKTSKHDWNPTQQKYGVSKILEVVNDGDRFPDTILNYKSAKGLHPTQKPVDLLEYLIKTYTNENEIILDFTMGSGSTGVACVNTNRSFIGIELDRDYFNIAKERIENAKGGVE